jgi:hypothetical protein
MRTLEHRRLILLALLVLGLAACRPIDPDLELTAHEAPVQSPLATQSASSSPLDVPPPEPLPRETSASAVQSPIQPPMTATRTTSVKPTAAANEEGSVRLVIMHTNDTWGYYDPCG